MRKIRLLQILPLAAALAIIGYVSGCGDDSGVTTTASGWPPAFNFKTGQVFIYTNDSIPYGGTNIRLRRGSYDVVQAQTTHGGQLCYPWQGATYDSLPTPHIYTPDLYYVYYDPAGKYYQFGIKKLINPTVPDTTWDLIGDFSVARGTSYSVGNVDYTLTLPPPYNSVTFSGPMNGKIADSTTISSTLNGEIIYCYLIQLTAAISGSYSGIPITANITINYYVGYSNSANPTNPVGLVDLNVQPFAFTTNGSVLFPEPGYDRKLYTHQNP